MSNITESARSRWTEIKQETREGANTATRVGDAGLLILDAIDTLDTLKAPLESPVFQRTLKLFYGDEEGDIFLIKKAEENGVPLVSITPQEIAIGVEIDAILLGSQTSYIYLGDSATNIIIGGNNFSQNMFIGEGIDRIQIGKSSYAIEIGYLSYIVDIGNAGNFVYIGDFAQNLNIGLDAISIMIGGGKEEQSISIGQAISSITFGELANLIKIGENASVIELFAPAVAEDVQSIYVQLSDNSLGVMSKSDFLAWLNN